MEADAIARHNNKCARPVALALVASFSHRRHLIHSDIPCIDYLEKGDLVEVLSWGVLRFDISPPIIW